MRTLPWLIVESARNLRAWRSAALVLALIGATSSYVAASGVIRESASAVMQQRFLDFQGRRGVVIRGSGAPMRGSECEGLRGTTGVISAFGVGPEHQVHLVTGEVITEQPVTAGFSNFVGARPNPTSALLGGSIAGRLGAVDGGWIAVNSGESDASSGEHVTLRVAVLRETARTTSFDDSLLLAATPSDPVKECRVDIAAPARDEVIEALQSSFPRSSAPIIVSAARELERTQEPEHRLTGLPTSPTTWFPGVISALLVLAWWFVRRSEWVLYQAFGMGLFRRCVLATLEWLAVGAVPLVVGAAWAVAFSTRGSPILSYELAGWTLLANLAIAGIAAPLLGLYLTTRSPYLVLQNK